MYLFNDTIYDWPSWGNVFQSIETFEPLIQYIFTTHNIALKQVEHCTPGTNAVFRVGEHIIKIFAPNESGMNTDYDYKMELFGIERANRLGISTPKLIVSGYVKDKYLFRYLIMEYIAGYSLGEMVNRLSNEEKYKVGKSLKVITDKLNIPTERFDNHDIIQKALSSKGWSCFTERFNEERKEYLKQYLGRDKDYVYVHGDLNPDNVVVGNDGKLYIIDFADAIIAPQEYELAALICELFCFEKPYMNGYFGKYDIYELTEKCFNGLLIHEYGSNIVRYNFGKVEEIMNLKILKERIYTAIDTGKQIEEK